MLAMNEKTPRGIRFPALSFTIIASMLAPTVSKAIKKPLDREIQGLCFIRQRDQAASILLRFCSTLFR